MRGGVGALVVLATLAMAPAALGAQETFNHTGGGALWTAPEGVVSATFDVYGGQGGNSIFVTSAGGLGGRATATLPVRPGRKYLVDVGGAGGFGEPIYMIAYGGSGSEVRSYPYDIEDRMIAAGGGGSSVSGDGPPGGVPGSKLGAINGGPSSPFTDYTGFAGTSWGPPGTSYEQGVRKGNGLVTITYDGFPQDTFIDSGPNGLSNDPTPTFTFSSDEADSTFECRIDSGAFDACSEPGGYHTTSGLSDGAHSFAVRAIDQESNADPTPAARDFTVDTTAPKVTVTKGPKGKIKTTKKKVEVEVSFKAEAGATFKCRLDGSRFKPCDSPYSVRAKSKSGRGKLHAIAVQAIDDAGNTGKATTTEFRVIRK